MWCRASKIHWRITEAPALVGPRLYWAWLIWSLWWPKALLRYYASNCRSSRRKHLHWRGCTCSFHARWCLCRLSLPVSLHASDMKDVALSKYSSIPFSTSRLFLPWQASRDFQWFSSWTKFSNLLSQDTPDILRLLATPQVFMWLDHWIMI